MKLTNKELTELNYMNYLGFKYIARGEKGVLGFYKEMPVRNKIANNIEATYYDTWVIGKYPIKDFSLYGDVVLGEYDFITWENGVWSVEDLINSK